RTISTVTTMPSTRFSTCATIWMATSAAARRLETPVACALINSPHDRKPALGKPRHLDRAPKIRDRDPWARISCAPMSEGEHGSLDERKPVDKRGLLIVNADDWGGFRAGTDAIESCFAIGAISSTTAMVHMADARRAAELAPHTGGAAGRPLTLPPTP